MRPLTLAALALLAGSSLAAQTAPTTPKKTLTLDVGFVNASGNSDFTSANLGEKATWSLNGWGFTQAGKALFGKTNGTRTAESYDVTARAERALSARIGVFLGGEFQRDPFAGLASRWSGGPGIGIAVVRTKQDSLGVESALTEQKERGTDGLSASFAATRSAAFFRHTLSGTAAISEGLVWDQNLKTGEDYRLNSETALIAPLSKKIGLRVSYLVRFDNQPEPGFKKSDRILTTGIQVAM
jgi:putative salt-induced outer membrane protein